jgi:hypothetical protein
MLVSKSAIPALDSYTPNHVNDISSSSEGRIICEPWVRLRKGFGFAGAWTVREQNRLLALCFGLPQVNKA